MIFNSSEEIQADIRDKVARYISREGLGINKDIYPLLWSYMQEMKRIGEIDDYVVDRADGNIIRVTFVWKNSQYTFEVSPDIEVRNLKIKKITST